MLSMENALVAAMKMKPNFYDQVIENIMAVDRRAEFHFNFSINIR
jgi:hypothetical protein